MKEWMNANEWMNALGFKIQLQALLKISPKKTFLVRRLTLNQYFPFLGRLDVETTQRWNDVQSDNVDTDGDDDWSSLA